MTEKIRKPNKFLEHLSKIRKENPNIKSQKDLIAIAKKTYKKVNNKEDKK